MQDNVILSLMSRYRRFIVFGLLFIVMAMVIWWLYGRGRLQLDSAQNNTDVTYYVSGNSNGLQQTTKPGTKILRSGRYTVLAVDGDKSYWTSVVVGHFLSKTTPKIALEAERSRSFVGNNPASCAEIINAVLVSHTCGGTADTIKVHVPASQQLPTSARSPSNGFTRQVEGIINTKGGPLYVRKQLESIGLPSAHSALSLNQAAGIITETGSATYLSGLKDDKTYTAVPYEDGFVMYDLTFRDVQYFSGPKASPKKLELPSVKGVDIPIRFDADGKSLLATYSNSVGDTDGSTPNPKTELVKYSNGKAKHFSLSGTYFATSLCGQQSICTIDETSGLTIYDASGGKLKKVAQVPDVSIMGRSGKDGLLFLKGRDVIYVNTTNGYGYIAYRLGNYQLNSISPSGNGALLNLTNTKGTGVMLELGESAVDSPIDKQVDVLLHSSNISDVSAYGKYLFISPNLGELEYVPASKSYGYSPEKKRKANDAVMADVKASGIDTTRFVIVNPYAD